MYGFRVSFSSLCIFLGYEFNAMAVSGAVCALVVVEMENTRDFHFPLRIKAKISEYAPILTFQIALSFQVNFHLALGQQRKNFRFFINSPQTLNLLIKLKFSKKI